MVEEAVLESLSADTILLILYISLTANLKLTEIFFRSKERSNVPPWPIQQWWDARIHHDSGQVTHNQRDDDHDDHDFPRQIEPTPTAKALSVCRQRRARQPRRLPERHQGYHASDQQTGYDHDHDNHERKNHEIILFMIKVNFLLPFMGFGFNYTWLSLHGHISFRFWHKMSNFDDFSSLFHPQQHPSPVPRVPLAVPDPQLAQRWRPLFHR